jgi:hypothetical protein
LLSSKEPKPSAFDTEDATDTEGNPFFAGSGYDFTEEQKIRKLGGVAKLRRWRA